MSDDFSPVFADLVRVFTASSGAGPFVPGLPVDGCRGFEALNAGDKFYYSVASAASPTQWEVGRGTLLEDGRIGREPLVSSAGGGLVDFAAGAKTIAVTVAGEWFADVPTLGQLDARYQLADAKLAAIAGLGASADRLPYFASAETAALAPLSPFGRSLIAGGDAAAARETLGLGAAAAKTIGTSGDAVPVLDGGPTSWAAGATFGGNVRASGIVKGTGLDVAGTGTGAELLYNAADELGGVGAYDRAAWAAKGMLVYGSTVWIWVGPTSSQQIASFDINGLQVAGEVRADRLRVAASAVPAGAGAAGTAGEIRWDENHLYVCVAANSWKRAALSTW